MPVAAILVASIRLHFLDIVLNAQTRGPTVFPCDVNVRKGDELGWFEHGSTIIVLAPDHFEFCDNVREGARIFAGQPLDAKARLNIRRRISTEAGSWSRFCQRASLYQLRSNTIRKLQKGLRWRERRFWRREVLCCGRRKRR